MAILMLILASIIPIALTEIMANAQENNVGAWLDRLYYHNARPIDDSVSYNQELDGYRMRSFYIRPEGFDVDHARIEMNTTYPNTQDYFLGINYNPTSSDPYYPKFDVISDDNYTFIWDWTTYPIPQASVGIHTNFLEPFQPGFDLTREWDTIPIDSPSVTQTLAIQFRSSTEFSEFFNVHISVQIPNTPEASPTIDEYSISADPSDDERGLPWNMDWNVDGDGNIGIDWHGDPQAGTTYTFSVDVTVENKLYPTPILYKPSVGVGANYDMPYPGGEDLGITPSVTILDDMDGVGGDDETSVTYAGLHLGTQLHWWYFTQKENSVSFPSYSAIAGKKGHFWLDSHDIVYVEGKDDWRSENTFSNLFSFGHMLTPWNGEIREWQVDDISYYGNENKITGTFAIGVRPPEPGQGGYVDGGKIFVSFKAKAERIMLISGEPNAHIHFWGEFEITGGVGQYTGLKGEGEISGTIHLHAPIDEAKPYYDLVLIGEWEQAD